jgi:hypothetical protein
MCKNDKIIIIHLPDFRDIKKVTKSHKGADIVQCSVVQHSEA